MDVFAGIPDWLGGTLATAAVGVLAFVVKGVWEAIDDVGRRRDARRGKLVELQALLRASESAFVVQALNRDRLYHLVEVNHSGVANLDEGYERVFSRSYAHFTDHERELHDVIRGITTHALRPVNEAMRDWLRSDAEFKSKLGTRGLNGDLARTLSDLEAHLILWQAKYSAWIPDNPEHALVYLADESDHGVGFPAGIAELVERKLTG